jgi:DNA helicase-2/ATP-dependent DNA helicase PcrA
MNDDILNMIIPAQKAHHERIPSAFQEAIYSATRETSDHILIEGVAGCGKTTTIIEATQFCAEPVMFLAFAKANADDVKGKILVGEAKTLNSLGNKMWWMNCRGARMDIDKLDKICHMLMSPEQQRKYGYLTRRIIQTAKYSGVGLDGRPEPQNFEHFITNGDWDIDDAEVSQVAELVCKVFVTSVSDMSTYDFDDQIYGPIFHRWDFPNFGTVLVDEAQDLNRIQHLFVEELVKAGCRLIAVGDRHQAIYAFRGALTNSMDELKAQFKMYELPLSVCYRCPTSVISEAQKFVPHIQARPGAPEGYVLHRSKAETALGDDDPDIKDPELFPDDWLILCRNNAPLFSCIMRHVRARKPCRVKSNVLDGLASFIKKFRTDSPQMLLMKVAAWLEKERLAAEAKGLDWKIAALEDKANTLNFLAEGFSTVSQMLDLLRTLQEGKVGPIFSTIHRAKGLEAEHVYFLRPDLVPGWWIKEKEALQQEYNLRYVAVTRAKQSLTYGLSQDIRRR